TRKLSDNLVGIMAELEAAVPQTMRRYLSEDVASQPRAELIVAFEAAFVAADHYQKYLVKAGALSKTALAAAPVTEMKASVSEQETVAGTANVLGRIARIEKLLSLAAWFEGESPAWLEWWKTLSAVDPLPDGTIPENHPETLSAHIGRIGKSLGEAEP